MKKGVLVLLIPAAIFIGLCCSLQGGDDGVSFKEVLKLTAGDAQNADFFAESVAVSGDYAITGAYGAGDEGAAYIFYRNQGGGGNWGQAKKLVSGDPVNSGSFGRSVAISGNYAIVGANQEGAAFSCRGAAYVFYRNQGGPDNWGQVKKLTASDAEDQDQFGISVAISGDYVIVGAQYENGAGSMSGPAYIYYRNQGGSDNWGEVTKLSASDAEDGDYFGGSVAISGNFAIVGAYSEDGAGMDRGAAYLYKNE
jgi:hypothetical protein